MELMELMQLEGNEVEKKKEGVDQVTGVDSGVSVPVAEDGTPLSKNQQKKLARLKHFTDTREEWKANKRAKKKAAKLRKREELATGSGSDNGLKRKAEEGGGGGENEDEIFGAMKGAEGEEPTSKKLKIEPVKRVLEPITLIMDCGFDEMMNDKEVISMSSQLTRCYAVNRSATHQVTLAVTSLNGRLLARYQNVMKSQHLKWRDVKFSDKEYEVTEENKTKGDLVYLTADSEDTIEDLVPGTSYIIGGIVDRNRYKSLCYNKAKAQGIRTAKLPIGEYIKMSSRFVLTTNQVVEIMLKYLECRDWKEAFMETIPQRKQPKLKSKKGEESGGHDDEEDAEGEDGAEEPIPAAAEAEMNDSESVTKKKREASTKNSVPGDNS